MHNECLLKLQEILTDTVIADIESLYKRYEKSHFYVCALSVNDDFSHVFLSLNAEENLDSKYTEISQENLIRKWNPTSWPYQNYQLDDKGRLQEANGLLYKLREAISNDIYTTQIETILIDVLFSEKNKIREILKNENLYLFVSMVDDAYSEELEAKSAKRLNSPVQYKLFLNRYKMESDFKLEAEEAWRNKNYTLFMDLISNVKDISLLEKKKIEYAKLQISK